MFYHSVVAFLLDCLLFCEPTKVPSLDVNNIPRIVETKYCDTLRTYLTVVTDIYNSCRTVATPAK